MTYPARCYKTRTFVVVPNLITFGNPRLQQSSVSATRSDNNINLTKPLKFRLVVDLVVHILYFVRWPQKVTNKEISLCPLNLRSDVTYWYPTNKPTEMTDEEIRRLAHFQSVADEFHTTQDVQLHGSSNMRVNEILLARFMTVRVKKRIIRKLGDWTCHFLTCYFCALHNTVALLRAWLCWDVTL